jgi:hypothetical protein
MRSTRPILACVLGLLALTSLWVAPVAQAASTTMVIDHFFTEDTFDNQVGFQIVLRCGGPSGPLHGTRTTYVFWEQLDCVDWQPKAFGCKYELRDIQTNAIILSYPIFCPDHIRYW